jgi:hypothetical protein
MYANTQMIYDERPYLLFNYIYSTQRALQQTAREIGMGILAIVGFLFGMILGQFFKCYVLFPACGLAIVLVLASPLNMDNSLLGSFLQFVVLTVSLQIGYVAGLVTGNFHREQKRSKRLKNAHFDESSSSR